MILTFSFSGGVGHELSIQWYRNDVALTDGTFGSVTITGAQVELVGSAGVMTAILTIENPTLAYSGTYKLTVTDNDLVECVLTSANLDVTVTGACELVITEQPASQEVAETGTLTLAVVATGGVGSLTYQWRLNGVALEDGPSVIGTISGANTDELEVTGVTPSAAGDYTVDVLDDGLADCSVTSDEAEVTVT
jgi:hypothetical protein